MKEKKSVGRPREHDRDKVFTDLIEWAKQSDSININKFCAHYEPCLAPSMILNWTREDPEYRRTYEKAKTFLAYRREEMLNKYQLHVKTYDLNATHYDLFLREDKRGDAEFTANLSKDIKNNLTDEERKAYDKLLDQLNRYQSKSKLNNKQEDNEE